MIGFGFIWMGFSLAAMVRVSLARCPRCGELFHMDRRFLASNPFTRRCMPCQLPLRA
jgi:hypothetical protein